MATEPIQDPLVAKKRSGRAQPTSTGRPQSAIRRPASNPAPERAAPRPPVRTGPPGPPGPPQPPRRRIRERPLSAAQVLIVGAIAFVLAALLNSQTLVDMANRQPFDSATRGLALAVTKPLHADRRGLPAHAARRGDRRHPRRRDEGSDTFAFDATTTTVAGAAGTAGTPAPPSPPAPPPHATTAVPATTAPRAHEGEQAPPLHRRRLAGAGLRRIARAAGRRHRARRADAGLQGLVGSHPTRLLRLAQAVAGPDAQAPARHRRDRLRRERRPADQGAGRQHVRPVRPEVARGVLPPRRPDDGLPHAATAAR